MDYLFSLKPNQTISEAIKSLSKFQISGLSSHAIIGRGYEYLSAGAVYPNVKINIGKYELEVSGSYGDYEVIIEQEQEKVYGSCDCPYEDGICKHLIATLLHLQNHVETHRLAEADITKAVIEEAEKVENDFEEYVDNLPIEELRKLVLDFAPERFRKIIAVKQNMGKGNTEKVDKGFKKVSTGLDDLFGGELYNIDEFIEDTDKVLEAFRPFWQTHSNKIANELANFFRNVNEAFDEGYLSGNYDSHYDEYYEDTYQGEHVSKYIGEFIASISAENQKYALLKLLKTKQQLDYGICDNMTMHVVDAVKTEDLPQFTKVVLEVNFFNYIPNNESQKLYDKIQPFLSETEKEALLKSQSNDSWFNFELAKYYEIKSDFEKAYDVLSEFLKVLNHGYYFSNNVENQQFQKIIQLCDEKLGGKNTLFWIEKYIKVLANQAAFETAIKHRPEKRKAFESYFAQHHVTTFAEILEAENRLLEVLQLFTAYKSKFSNTAIYAFYQRHKLQFPKEAAIVFKRELDIYLPEARQSNYEKVGEILSELKPILSATEFHAIVANIKTKYYRRRNLIGILKGKGFL